MISAASATSATPTPKAWRLLILAPRIGTDRATMRSETLANRAADRPDGISEPPTFISAYGAAK
jgi:hypothetical protein